MKRSSFFLLVVLTLVFVLVFCSQVFAINVEDLPEGIGISDQNININANIEDGSFENLTYIVSSTGATSGIRYRTSAITITLGGQTAVINISSLGGTPSGVHQFTQITIDKEDIIKALPSANLAQLNAAFANPSSIQIGAQIQIYNAGTGQVLANITNRDDVAPVASEFGFGSQDIADMESRFQQNGYSSGPVTPPNNNPDTPLQPGDQGYGLRPSILVE